MKSILSIRILGLGIGLAGILVFEMISCLARTQDRYPEYIFAEEGMESFSFLGQRFSKNYWVEVKHHGTTAADIIVHKNGRDIKMKDIKIEVLQNNDKNGKMVTLQPGQTFKSYDFYLSADEEWMCIRRGGFRRFSVGYLYKRDAKNTMAPYLVNGYRLDEACLRLYAKQKGISAKLLGGGARTIQFEKLDQKTHKLYFSMEASSYWYIAKSENVVPLAGEWRACFDLKRQKLSILN